MSNHSATGPWRYDEPPKDGTEILTNGFDEFPYPAVVYWRQDTYRGWGWGLMGSSNLLKSDPRPWAEIHEPPTEEGRDADIDASN